MSPVDDLAAIGGSGFGLMCIIVAVERGWITRAAAVTRIGAMLEVLTRAPCYHGAFPHFPERTHRRHDCLLAQR